MRALDQKGEVRAAVHLGIARETLIRILAGRGLRRGTVLLVRSTGGIGAGAFAAR